MKHSLIPISLCLLCCAFAAQAKPQVVTIPLPQGQSMQFVLVRVSDSPNLFSSVEFKLGDKLTSGMNNRQTATSVSGTVYVKGTGTQSGYWAIPVAQYEVTRAQYAAVMGEPMPAAAEAMLPVAGITRTQISAFLEKLNTWLYSDKANKATMNKIGTSSRHGSPFVRLPLEAEWEFAARGGLEVDRSRFESGMPYADTTELGKAEVLFSGRPRQAPEKVGSTGVCNPCGIYDMLGNVSEAVQDTFRPEYHFGRAGGYVNCGASYTDDVKSSTAYFRTESPIVNRKGEPWSENKLGFRPVLGSSIYSFSLAGDTMESEWSEYLEPRGGERLVVRPGDSTTDDTVKRLEKEKADLAGQIASLSASMQQLSAGKGTNEKQLGDLKDSVREMQSRINEMQAIVNQSYIDVADAGVEMLSTACAFTTQDAFDEWQCRVLRSDPECTGENRKKIAQSVEDRKANVEGYWQTYIKGCRALCCVDESIRSKAMAQKRKLIAEKNPPQLPVFDLSVQYFNIYVKQGKFSQSDFAEWKKALLKAAIKRSGINMNLIDFDKI